MHKNPDHSKVLNNKLFREATNYLINLDQDLASIINNYGRPKIFYRKPGFSSLLYIILEQQVSLASAAATFNKLLSAVKILTPEKFLKFSDAELKGLGFSRQKTHYCRLLARELSSNRLNLDSLIYLDDDSVRSELMKLRGVGRWTADNYLLFVLKRADVFPCGDLALINAIKSVKKLRNHPDDKRIIKISHKWKPWRSVAARILWHYYLSN